MSGAQDENESGAVAILVALLTVVIFAVAALAVDLSNAFVRKRDVQAQADLAALAGAAELPESKDGAVKKVIEFLNHNQPQDDKPISEVTQSDLQNGDPSDGEVYFEGPVRIRVVTPPARVAYGVARVLNFEAVDVAAEATAGVYSPGLGVMPSYAWDGCDWGPQYILDNTGTLAAPLPTLGYDDPANGAKVEDLDFDEAANFLQISGKQLTGVTAVGFFREGGSPVIVPVTPAGPGSTSVSLSVPSSVTSVEEVWWVRVMKDGDPDPTWSPVLHGYIQPFPIGDVAPECDSYSTEGNFGTLDIPRPSGDASGWEVLAKNIATSLEVSLSVYPEGESICTSLLSLPYIHFPDQPANCVPVKTGFPNPDVMRGLIQGVGTSPGRLDTANGNTNDLCGGASAEFGGVDINNDYLSCFFTDDSLTIDDISRGSYSGDPALDPAIFDSPRFIWLPIVRVEPANGTSEKYTLVDVRPAFITDQLKTATRTSPQLGPDTINGLLDHPSGVRAVKATIFDLDALPPAKDGSKVTPYVGVGQKIIRLVD